MVWGVAAVLHLELQLWPSRILDDSDEENVVFINSQRASRSR